MGSAFAQGAGQGRDRIRSVLVALVLLAAYLSNGDLSVRNDATGNVIVAVNVIEDGRVTFTSTRDPAHFRWRLGPPLDRPAGRVQSAEALVAGQPARELWERGLLQPVANEYYVTRTLRLDPVTGERLYVGTFGPTTGLVAVPVLAAARLVGGDLRRNPEAAWYGAKVAAAILVAASGALVYLAARAWLSPLLATILALAYGLGTCVWSVSSQALWQHPAAEFFLALGSLFLVRARNDRRLGWIAAGAAFACAGAARPPDAVFALAVAGWIAFARRPALVPFLAGCAPVAIALGAYNTWFFGVPWSFGQTEVGGVIAAYKTGNPDLWQTPILEGLAGTLLSPSRGLVVFSPILLLGFAGGVLAWRRDAYAVLRPLAVGAVALLLLESKWFDWWGGWTFGYRRVVDLAPVLAILAVPAVGWVVAAPWRSAVASLALAWSVAVQILGAFAYTPNGWNTRQSSSKVSQDVDEPAHRARLWSWTDAQLPFLVEHFRAERAERGRLTRAWIEEWRPRGSR